jgi:phosphoglycolate phosphatase
MLQSSIIEIQPFSEMRQVIADIKRSGIQIGLLSSNAEENVRSFLDEHDFPVFDFVEAGSSLFGKAKHLKRICRTYGLDPQTVAYVGDEIRDIEAAKSVGMHMLAVSWGFSAKEALSGADAICLEPGDILNAIPAPHSDSVRSF